MKKQILKRGYVTNALTNGDSVIYGTIKDYHINFETYKESKKFYWSEVYCEPNHFFSILRKGQLLVNPSSDKLKELMEQSKINLHE